MSATSKEYIEKKIVIDNLKRNSIDVILSSNPVIDRVNCKIYNKYIYDETESFLKNMSRYGFNPIQIYKELKKSILNLKNKRKSILQGNSQPVGKLDAIKFWITGLFLFFCFIFLSILTLAVVKYLLVIFMRGLTKVFKVPDNIIERFITDLYKGVFEEEPAFKFREDVGKSSGIFKRVIYFVLNDREIFE